MHALEKMEGDLPLRVILSSLDKHLQLEMKSNAYGAGWIIPRTIYWFMN